MTFDPVAVLNMQIEALYRCDERGQLVAINEPNGQAAPLVFWGRTVAGNLWRTRYDLPPALVTAVDEVCRSEPVVADFAAPLQGYDALSALLAAFAPVRSVWRGPCYVFGEPVAQPDGVVQLVDADAPLLARYFADWLPLEAEREPYVIKVVDGAAVALCCSSRRTLQACEAGVETAAAYRGRGYGATVVAGWAAAVQQSGRSALYSTSWDNRASQGVARSLGLTLYGEDISFEEDSA